MTGQQRFVDTTTGARQVYIAAYQALSGAERVERSMTMADEVKQVALAGIAHRNPTYTRAQIHREWLRILHGERLSKLLS